MRATADVEVAVLSGRSDLDVVISTRLPGYSAQRTDDLDRVIDVTGRGGVVLIDLGSPRHEEWVSALHDRGFDGPMVFLDPRGEMTLDLRERVVVPSPPTLSGLLSGFEVARSQQQARRRRHSRSAERSARGRVGRRSAGTSPAPGAPGEPAPASPAGSGTSRTASEEDLSVVPRARRADGGQDERSGTGSARVRRVDAGRRLESGRGVARARRANRQHATQADSSGGSPPRRVADARPAGADVAGAAVRSSSARLDADAAQPFREVFYDAEAQPPVHRRIETPAGRVRIQTEEELFAGHAAAPSLATVLTLPSAAQRRQRGAPIGA